MKSGKPAAVVAVGNSCGFGGNFPAASGPSGPHSIIDECQKSKDRSQHVQAVQQLLWHHTSGIAVFLGGQVPGHDAARRAGVAAKLCLLNASYVYSTQGLAIGAALGGRTSRRN